MAHTAYTAMVDYNDSKEFLNKLEKLIDVVRDNAEEKDGTVILSLSRDDYYGIVSALGKSRVVACSYKDTIGRIMAATQMPDTLV